MSASALGLAGLLPFVTPLLTGVPWCPAVVVSGGNCKTSLIVCISPADSDVTETLSSLRFASRAKFVKNVAKINAHIEASDLQSEALAEMLQSRLDHDKVSRRTHMHGHARSGVACGSVLADQQTC